MKKVTCPKRERKPFITSEIVTEKSKRSKLETIYRRCKTPENQNNFKVQSRHVAKLITISKRSYFRNLVSQCVKQPKKLWSALDTLFSRNSPPVLPNCISSSTLATSFLQFFDQKITKLCASLPTSANSLKSKVFGVFCIEGSLGADPPSAVQPSPAHVQCSHNVAGVKRARQFTTFAAFLNTATHSFFPRGQNYRLSQP